MTNLDTIPRIHLATLPTPLEEAPRLAHSIGLSRLLIKRDDLTGLAGGGSKARKLEYEFTEIVRGGYDLVLTAGGIQSNHARMTAAAARKLGLEIKLVLGGPNFTLPAGNLLLDAVFDAEVRYLVDNDANDHLQVAMEQWAVELAASGHKPFIIPVGGSTAMGALGYVRAMHELSKQLTDDRVQIVIGVGSCATLAGTLLGARLFLPQARVIGISVSRTVAEIKSRTAGLVHACAALIDHPGDFSETDIESYADYYDEYGRITPAGTEAIRKSALLEGLLLDPIYTGKVMAGVIDLAARDILDRDLPVVFIHTGGLPIIFSFAHELGGALRCTRVPPAD
ncbi:MAG TPA: D-cysteine desulfhydrase family protein [bacterium]|nr:D-cysteine desulfhydrase family protein [bacterium]HPR89140.1 D-cysteine desulfhydrase family protein [bacterium]